MTEQPDKWFSVSVTVAPEYTEAAEFAFNGLDSLGSEADLLSNKNSDLVTVTAYFSSPPGDGSIQNELKYAARTYGLSPDVDFGVRRSVVEKQDWLAEWKKYWKPVEIGRFVIAAPWHEVAEEDKTVVRIEPNMAFGTGTHQTTQLCLEAIDRNYGSGQTFLDVGTGTGILAIAAAMMRPGEEKISAVDTDADALAIARVNAELNGVAGRINFSVRSIDETTTRCDLVCANLTADAIVPMLPLLLAKTAATLVLSGILAEQERMIIDRLPERPGLQVNRAGEWIAIILNIAS